MKAQYIWTAKGPAKVIKEDQARMQVLLSGRKRPIWVSKTQLPAMPKLIRMSKSAKFDQDCGCHAAVDIRGNTYDVFNVYGSIKKFAKSEVTAGNDSSPHIRRKQLAESGFTRARGRSYKTASPAQIVHSYLRKGYEIKATRA